MASTEDNPKISTTFGIKDDIFRIVISQFLCYLIAIIYNNFFVKRSVPIKHIFNFVCGLLIVYYNFGLDVGHSLATIIVSWSIMKLLGPTRTMVGINFTFVLGYLLYGYHINKSTHSTIFTWTLPQCVLTLSLIAQGWDIYDGRVNMSNKAKGVSNIINDDTALESAPSLLETLSKSYFPSTVLIGPQIRFKDFFVFIENNENLLPFCWKQSVIRLCLGVLYFAVFQAGLTYLPTSFFTTEAFKSYNFVAKLCLLAFHNKVVLSKYLSAWLLSEGACIMYGISRDPISGQISRCFNINVTQYETTSTFGGLIESFNMTTNAFAFRYIFKRLKFLNSKHLSQFVTLLFLAVWHGFALGYYNTFALEMAIMILEKDIGKIVSKYRSRNQTLNQLLNNSIVRCLLYIAMRLHVTLMFSYAFTSFGFLEYEKWTAIMGELYWIGHFIYFSWILVSVVFRF